MSFLALLLMAAADDPADTLAKKMLPIYVKEAGEYSIAVASAPKKPLDVEEGAGLRVVQPDPQRRPAGRRLPVAAGRPPGRRRVHLLLARDA